MIPLWKFKDMKNRIKDFKLYLVKLFTFLGLNFFSKRIFIDRKGRWRITD